MQIGFLASHNGSNMQAIIDACIAGTLDAIPAVVISNNGNSGALLRAQREGIANYHISGKAHPEPEEEDKAILNAMLKHDVDTIVLAGYMKKLGPLTLSYFPGRILNIHPALLPKFGGKGMYGIHVHEAVIAAGETETGVTIHIVDEDYDAGPIIAQTRVPVDPDDTPEALAARVLKQEHAIFPEVLQQIATGMITLDSRANITWDGKPASSEPPYGASVIVYRRIDRGLEFLLLHRAQAGPDYEGDWAWTPPSGARIPGEELEKCALRELKEESGLELRIRKTDFGTEDWAVFMAEAPSNSLIRVGLDNEHDRFEWMDLKKVRERCRPELVLNHIESVAAAISGAT